MMMLEEIFQHATEMQATDIHFCPEEKEYKVLFRVAGKLNVFLRQAPGNLINRLKIMANLDLSETRRTQEGQFKYSINQRLFFIRVSIIATQKGEKIALRLLHQNKIRQLEELNLPHELSEEINKALLQDSGLFLVCGATGAGKTTTLYACLEKLNKCNKAIFTIEDPIEYEVDNYFQCEPQLAINITHTSLLKSFMRQDPDVILVGELRDAETAQLAITAALTGHMVFATLHSNSVIDAIHRMQSWQVDFFAFSSVIRLILHQKMYFDCANAKPIFFGATPNWSIENRPTQYKDLTQTNTLWSFIGNKQE
ncbi:ATPase, T2SS/T4P/T4SS family [Marinomonas sp. S3726]|uniref:GspE/PulE family protein n=1 Tax=Marinomonas sp. S3726 TaxID=579484 RepID=UPI000B2FC76E|nr:ATPase, T2SS/T4P/T4SS family [Marinomonas sp. S3726]